MIQVEQMARRLARVKDVDCFTFEVYGVHQSRPGDMDFLVSSARAVGDRLDIEFVNQANDGWYVVSLFSPRELTLAKEKLEVRDATRVAVNRCKLAALGEDEAAVLENATVIDPTPGNNMWALRMMRE